MPTFLEDLATVYLPGVGSLGLTFGTNLFGGILPNSPDNATALLEYQGEPPDYVFGPNPLPAISHPRFQVLTRNLQYLPGRHQIESIVRALEKITNQTVNGTYYERVERLQDPFYSHRDQARRVFFRCNLAVMQTPS